MKQYRAIIVTIGDELLIGQTIDTNSAWLARQFNALGIEVWRRVAVSDTREGIWQALEEELPQADLLVFTGGLGPTSDDITKPLLCEYFGGQLVVNEQVLVHVRELFARRNRPMLARNEKQAEVPDNCTVLFNKMGTAPGMWFERDGKVIISLPGVPFEMKNIMEEVALPRLAARFGGGAIVHKTLFTAGEGESAIAQKLEAFEAALPNNIKLAYLPDSGMVRLRLSGTDAKENEEALNEKTGQLLSEMAGLLGDIVYAHEDIPLEQILGNELRKRGKTMGIAESCTGGTIGHYMTMVPGASAYFMGSIVSYDNAVKVRVLGVPEATIAEQGAVSEATVLAMARGARELLQVDYTVSVSGVLGPDGGTDRAPVGTVWMAVASEKGARARDFRFWYDRERNKEMAAKNAMLLLLKYIKSQA
ncbi:MAG: CinA family nicotinamide mononucleotide deamidase-related protein [Chitinophagia bacterium]|nr:CinA family nicotinamide mononucleotide deamidase-related protein [Chitinophagia bacterium]